MNELHQSIVPRESFESTIAGTTSMTKTHALYIWMHPIPDSFNRVMYQRPLFIAQKYSMVFLAMGEKQIPEEIARKCTVIRSPLGKNSVLGPLLYFLSVLLYLLKYMRRRHNTVVHTFHDLSIFFGIVAKLMGYTWITDIWDDPALPLYISSTSRRARAIARIRVLLATLFIRYADVIIASIRSELLKRYHVDYAKVCAIPNGVDIERTRSVAGTVTGTWEPGRDADQNSLRIVYVGPVIRERAVDVLIRASATAAAKGYNIHLILAGPVGEATYMQALIERFRHISTFKCDLLGPVEHPRALRLVAGADIAVHLTLPIPNYMYAYPIKVFEYMALGKAIISSRSHTMNHIFHHKENGILVDVDEEEIAEAIIWLAQNPHKRAMLGENAYQTAQNYDWAQIHRKLSTCLDSIIGA